MSEQGTELAQDVPKGAAPFLYYQRFPSVPIGEFSKARILVRLCSVRHADNHGSRRSMDCPSTQESGDE